jgi:hypothetical protein
MSAPILQKPQNMHPDNKTSIDESNDWLGEDNKIIFLTSLEEKYIF